MTLEREVVRRGFTKEQWKGKEQADQMATMGLQLGKHRSPFMVANMTAWPHRFAAVHDDEIVLEPINQHISQWWEKELDNILST